MIHSTAIIESGAQIASDVSVGPYTIIGGDVKIDSGSVIGPHVVINGDTSIGKNTRIYQFASVGEEPQDKKYKGERTRTQIGEGNTIRESVTINRGTEGGGKLTKVGNNNWIMAYVHIAHDCMIGNNTIFANNVTLAGHVSIEDWVILGGFSLVHQFCRLGESCFTAMGAHINRDVPPFVMAAGQMAVPRGINAEGLKRRGMSADQIRRIKQNYKILYKNGLRLDGALKELHQQEKHDDVLTLLNFLEASERSIIR